MNGQSYVSSGLKSLNGTTQTPSSNSYPASLSSQSSRDTSPSRLASGANHLNQDNKPVSTSNVPYKYHNDLGYGNSIDNSTLNETNHDFTGAPLSGYQYGTANNSSVGSFDRNKLISGAKVPQNQLNYVPQGHNAVLNSSVPRAAMPGAYAQNSIYQKHDGSEDPVYSNIGPGLTANYVKSDSYPASYIHPDPVKGDTGDSILTADVSSKLASPPVSSYSSNQMYSQLQQQNYLPPQQQQQGKQRDQPLSSGPPRTNALGIIPYSMDTTTSTAPSRSTAMPTSSNPSTASPIYSNVNPASPSYSQQPPSSQAHGYQAQPTGYNNQVGYQSPGYAQAGQQIASPSSNSMSLQQQSSVSTYTQPVSTTFQQATISPSYSYSGYPPSSGYATSMAQPPFSSAATAYQGQSSGSQSISSHYPRISTAAVSPMRTSNQMPPNSSQPPQYQQVSPPYSSQVMGQYKGMEELSGHMSNLSVANAGYNQLWGHNTVDLLKCKDILPTGKVEPPAIRLQHELYESSNCSPELFRCTLTKIPETKSLLDKSRLPLGVLIHPFKDLNQLSVIQCSVIVRCRSCRTYINPFVYFVDAKHWKCNLCFRVNELPDEFQYDPLTKTYGDPSRRPEIKSATIEFIAPSEYMVRPPQPAAYVFVLDVSRWACDSGYLKIACETLLDQLEALPGDARTSVAFITFDSSVHYYSLAETQSLPHQMVIMDVDDMFLPSPDNLIVNLSECLILVRDLLRELPNKFKESYDTGSALGAALQAAYKLLAPTGGRVTVFTSTLVSRGPGLLTSREDPAQRSGENVTQSLLNPVTDFYKKLALDCSGQQIAVDLFVLNSQYVDLATISGISRFSGGCMHHFPLFNMKNIHTVELFQRTLQRYLCRKIGFESVMRLRCTRGLSIHTFHGNFFVRSTDLLSLPNINPDSGFGMQVSIDDNLSDIQNVCFQAALLYTSSKGERRIRVHTLCLPVATNLSDVLHSADQQCIIGLLAKMAVDRCHQSSLGDAREAFVNVVSDVLSVFKLTQSNYSTSSLMAPQNLCLLPVYILALLKSTAFRIGHSTRLDDRVFSMCQLKSLPLSQLILSIYPDLYPVHNLEVYPEINIGDGETVAQPPRLQLSSERIDSTGIYLMDDGEVVMIYVGQSVQPHLIKAIFDVPYFNNLDPNMAGLPDLKTPESIRLRNFISYLQNEKPVSPVVQVIRSDSQLRQKFVERLVEDKNESGFSYYEFLQNVRGYVK